MSRWLTCIVLCIVMGFGSDVFAVEDPEVYQSNPSREFIMSCTYGVLAGTLVGVASLAFVDKPSESLNRVARGASLGLYSGILLGLYVVYVIPNSIEEETEDPVALSLLFNDKDRVDGLKADFTLWRF